jgi:hypothetical protein
MSTTHVLTTILERVEGDENKLTLEVEEILEFLINHSKAGSIALRWACRRTTATYTSEVARLVQRENGLHFTAKKTTAERLREFDINALASKMQALAPNLWSLLDSLLAADSKVNYKREWRSGKAPGGDNTLQTGGDLDLDMLDVCDPDEEYWKDVDENPLVGDGDDEPEDAEDQKGQRTERLTMTVSAIQCFIKQINRL